MKKKIEDYLHLYLGCECIIGDSITTETIEAVSKNSICTGENKYGIDCWYKISAAKPILRPLSDMTEEEEKYVGLGLKAGIANASMLKSRYFHSMTPKVFYYLLSKHFDLFGLIESGFAVNAAEINSVSS